MSGCFLPPHILHSIAERAEGDLRERALATLERSAQFRGARTIAGDLGVVLGLPAGQKRRTVYDARHGTQLPGKLVRGEASPASGDAAVDEAYDGAGKTYDFFREALGRNSVDGRGMRLDASVHYDVDFDNAQWNGRQMIYGDGDRKLFNRFTASLDVIAHELAHGVTQFTANLVYSGQAGALNEHFSDVFGVLTRQYALKQTARKADWLIGAGLFTRRVKGVAVRSMKSPGTAYDDPLLGHDPQPAHMRDYKKMRSDNGGVHVNSGIPNRAFYLAAVALGGRAWEVAGKVWYDALTRRLGTKATFADSAKATVASAEELFGSEAGAAVREAWKSVGVLS